MNNLDYAIVTPDRIDKALRLGNLSGVQRLARFVSSPSLTSSYKIFEACQQQRVQLWLMSLPKFCEPADCMHK